MRAAFMPSYPNGRFGDEPRSPGQRTRRDSLVHRGSEPRGGSCSMSIMQPGAKRLDDRLFPCSRLTPGMSPIRRAHMCASHMASSEPSYSASALSKAVTREVATCTTSRSRMPSSKEALMSLYRAEASAASAREITRRQIIAVESIHSEAAALFATGEAPGESLHMLLSAKDISEVLIALVATTRNQSCM